MQSADRRVLASITSEAGLWVALLWADQVISADMFERGLPVAEVVA